MKGKWMSPRRFLISITLFGAALGVLMLLSLGVGAVPIPLKQVVGVLFNPSALSSDPTSVAIIMNFRLARVLLAALVGGGLAAAGAAFQALFRNPLADPYVIGASGGAALGATLAIISGLTLRFAGFGPVQLAAFCGALLSVVAVYSITETGGKAPVVSLLLAGVTLSTVLSAIVSFLMLLYDRDLPEIFSWLIGGLSGRSWPHLLSSGPYLLLGFFILWLLARPLDALACGEETARTFGLSLPHARGAVVAAASLITAAAVAAGGVIGFVGLVAPHIARLFFGAAHNRLIPASALTGAVLMVAADDLARTVLAPLEMPAGIITAMLGGTFFLYLLKTRR
jgi:iron complex transport system permease protein